MVGTRPKGSSSRQGGFGSSRKRREQQGGTSPSCQTPHSQCKPSLEPPKPGGKPAGIAPIHHFLLFFLKKKFPLLAMELRPVWRGCSPSASLCSRWVFWGFFGEQLGFAATKVPDGVSWGFQKDGFCLHGIFRAPPPPHGAPPAFPVPSRCHPALEMWFQ